MEVRDPLHGFVHLSEVEKSVINSIPFQRLRNIKQLGMGHYVYPGSVHTRLEHSIGTLYIGSQIFGVLTNKHREYLERILQIPKENGIKKFRSILRYALLLHDVGHAPFSHSSEDLSPKGISHEELGARIVKEKLEYVFRQTDIKRAGIEIDDVVYLIYPDIATEVPEESQIFNLLSSIISGEIDADRIDYLTRDSHHTGVIYGKFDYMRLIDTITFIPYVGEALKGQEDFDLIPESPEPRIGLEYGGLHTVEGLLLARYYMFTQVYFSPHKKNLRPYTDRLPEVFSARWKLPFGC